MDGGMVSGLFSQPTEGPFCFNYNACTYYSYAPCNASKIHASNRYDDTSAVWVLISAIIVFFMKAGFMLVEISFAQNVVEKRHVVVVKYLDVFASSFGFFLIGFDAISDYSSPQGKPHQFFQITDPILWFFKFTFASNAATIIGGCLVTNKYKLRLPAAFISAFVISGIIHPVIARLIWSDQASSLSPYRFCSNSTIYNDNAVTQGFTCVHKQPLSDRLYVLDFAGGGAVHLLGGVAGLVLCLFAKLQKWLDDRKLRRERLNNGLLEDTDGEEDMREEGEDVKYENFWDWMYPVHGGGETTSEAALGVLILWFCWFAFNCGSTESVQSNSEKNNLIPYHAVPSIIAVNMILAGASGGLLAVIIAVWAQLRSSTESVNANEIANGVLSSLVAITAGCPFVSYWGACIIGVVAVVLYHFGCWVEYRLGIVDTARVVPVHGICGLWSVLSVGILVFGSEALCNLHVTFEGLCYCELRLPLLNYGERLASQLVGAVIMIGITAVISVIMYGTLFLLPINPFSCCCRHFNVPQSCANGFARFMRLLFKRERLQFEGNWLLTSPNENCRQPIAIANHGARQYGDLSGSSSSQQQRRPQLEQNHYGAVIHHRETLGTVNSSNQPISVSFSSQQYTNTQRRDGSSQQRLTNSSKQRTTTTHSAPRNGASYHRTDPNSANLIDDQYMSEEEHQVDL